jgi:DDE superfamily endonuclease
MHFLSPQELVGRRTRRDQLAPPAIVSEARATPGRKHLSATPTDTSENELLTVLHRLRQENATLSKRDNAITKQAEKLRTELAAEKLRLGEAKMTLKNAWKLFDTELAAAILVRDKAVQENANQQLLLVQLQRKVDSAWTFEYMMALKPEVLRALVGLPGDRFFTFVETLGLLGFSAWGKTHKIDYRTAIAITAIKVREDWQDVVLGHLFKVSDRTIGNYFQDVVLFTARAYCLVYKFRDLAEVEARRVDILKGDYSLVTSIPDCTELPSEKLREKRLTKQQFSTYKGGDTAKALVSLDQSFECNYFGLWTLAFQASDTNIVKLGKDFMGRKYINDQTLPPNALAMPDKGFPIEALLVEAGRNNHLITPRTVVQGQLSALAVEDSAATTRRRTHIERFNRRIKIHRYFWRLRVVRYPIIDEVTLFFLFKEFFNTPLMADPLPE